MFCFRAVCSSIFPNMLIQFFWCLLGYPGQPGFPGPPGPRGGSAISTGILGPPGDAGLPGLDGERGNSALWSVTIQLTRIIF